MHPAPPSRIRLLLATLAACALLLLDLAVWQALRTDRRHTLEAAQLANRSRAEATQDQLARILESIDVLLRYLVVDPHLPELDTGFRTSYRQSLGFLRNVVLLDARGRAGASKPIAAALGQDFSAREYFALHRDGHVAGMHVSAPLRSPVDGRAIIALTRRLETPDGGFGGIAVASLDVDRLAQFYRTLELAPGQSLALLAPDGEDVLGGPAAGGTTLAATRPVAGTPYAVQVTIREDVALANWRQRAGAAALATLAADLLILGFAVALDARLRAAAHLHARLVDSERRQDTLLRAIPDLLIVYDAEGRYRQIFCADPTMLVADAEQLLGRTLAEVLPPAVAERGMEVIARALAGGDEIHLFEYDMPVRGEHRHFAARALRLPDEPPQVLWLVRDVSAQHRLNQQIRHQASHDPLTGLVNRREFERRLEAALAEAEDGARHALLYIDLDRFKAVNDSAGHLAGDALLREVVTLMAGHARTADVLARLGGDEFGLLLHGCPLDKAVEIGQTLVDALHAWRFDWDGRRFEIGASIGVVPIDAASGGLDALLGCADAACYAAKHDGRGCVRTPDAAG